MLFVLSIVLANKIEQTKDPIHAFVSLEKKNIMNKYKQSFLQLVMFCDIYLGEKYNQRLVIRFHPFLMRI